MLCYSPTILRYVQFPPGGLFQNKPIAGSNYAWVAPWFSAEIIILYFLNPQLNSTLAKEFKWSSRPVQSGRESSLGRRSELSNCYKYRSTDTNFFSISKTSPTRVKWFKWYVQTSNHWMLYKLQLETKKNFETECLEYQTSIWKLLGRNKHFIRVCTKQRNWLVTRQCSCIYFFLPPPPASMVATLMKMLRVSI